MLSAQDQLAALEQHRLRRFAPAGFEKGYGADLLSVISDPHWPWETLLAIGQSPCGENCARSFRGSGSCLLRRRKMTDVRGRSQGKRANTDQQRNYKGSLRSREPASRLLTPNLLLPSYHHHHGVQQRYPQSGQRL